MTENPQRPSRSLSNFKLRTAMLYALPGVLLMVVGWYYGRPPALFLVCWALLGVGMGAFSCWKSKSTMPPIFLLVMMMGNIFMSRYFLDLSFVEALLSIHFAGLAAWYLGVLFCICIFKTARRERIQPQVVGRPL